MIYFFSCVHIARSSENITVLGFHQFFDEIVLSQFISHDAFHFSVRQRNQKLILRQILNIYICIKLINKGLSIVRQSRKKKLGPGIAFILGSCC